MKKSVVVAIILCSIPIGLLGCSEKKIEQVVNQNVQDEVSSSKKGNGGFYLYKDCTEDYNNRPNLIGKVKSELKFKLDTDMSEHGYSIYNRGLTEDNFNNITNFNQIEDILAKHGRFPNVIEIIEIHLDEEILEPNIVLNRAKDIGEWIPKQDFKITTYNTKEETYIEMDQWYEHALVISKLDGLALNSTEETKFKLLNYTIDNLQNIESLTTKEELLKYAYLNTYLQTAFREANSSVISLLDNLEAVIEMKLQLVHELTDSDYDDRAGKFSESLIRDYLELVYRDLKEVSKLE